MTGMLLNMSTAAVVPVVMNVQLTIVVPESTIHMVLSPLFAVNVQPSIVGDEAIMYMMLGPSFPVKMQLAIVGLAKERWIAAPSSAAPFLIVRSLMADLGSS